MLAKRGSDLRGPQFSPDLQFVSLFISMLVRPGANLDTVRVCTALNLGGTRLGEGPNSARLPTSVSGQSTGRRRTRVIQKLHRPIVSCSQGDTLRASSPAAAAGSMASGAR